MLHRVLSVTTVKIVCCHNAIPHILRDEMTYGSCQLYTWRLNLKHALSFNCPLSTKLVLTLTEYIMIQSELKKQDKKRFCRKYFSTCEFLT